MDDIYDNLENYNEVNAVAELRDENKELKLKIQEYATSMDKLQKDFDKLASEFKNLEKNYSALLKTARAEIERKTQTITNLNIEKDMLVLNSLQGSRNNLNIKRNMLGDGGNMREKRIGDKHRRDDSITNKKENNLVETLDVNLKLKNQDDERNVQNHLPAEETTSSVNKKKMTSINESSDNLDSYNKRKSERKENVDQVLSKYSKKSHKEDETKAHSSKNRRKSVISNPDPKFSTDEEGEDKRDVEDRNKMDFFLRDYMERESFDINNKQNIKASDTVEKYSDYKINRHDRSYDGDKYRNRDKNESYRRHKRHHSPEILNRRSKRDYVDDYHHRSEHGRGRILENFVDDDYYHQHRSRDNRIYYEREHPNDFDRHRHQEKYTTKHKIQNDYDGVSNKRSRKDSYIYTEEDRRKHIEKDFAEKQATFDKTKQHQQSSCQSPDHAQIDNSISIKPIREIMNTAESQIEDPRLTHKKYDNTTNNSRIIELKIIDATKWKTERLRLPDTLVQRPPRLSDELVKEIFMNIENTTPKSVESGEIVESESNEPIFTNMTTKNFHKTMESEFNDQINIEKETLDKLQTSLENTLKTKDPLRLQYIKETILETENPKEHSSYIVSTSINDDNYWEETKKNKSSDSNKLASIMDQDKDEKLVFYFDNGKHINDSFTKSQKILSSKEIVEGDLELSDETCDNLGFQDEIAEEKRAVCSENSNNHRKKSYKYKESNSKGRIKHNTPEIKQELNKKSKSRKKEPKPEHIKTKFTDLFGDSSSLITPEDLNIVPGEIQSLSPKKYVPMFEDAVDLNVEDIMKVKTLSTKTENDVALIETKSDVLDDDIDSKSKSKKIDKANAENRNEVFKSNDDSNSLPNENSEFTDIYENLNSEVVTVTDPNIVKTVIISLGLQPQCIPTNEVKLNVNEQSVIHEVGGEKDSNNCNIAALATSVPLKTMENVKIKNESGSVLEPNCTPTVCVPQVVDNVGHSSNTKLTECQSDTDAPDVRIFVRRRRKVLKKPTLNEG